MTTAGQAQRTADQPMAAAPGHWSWSTSGPSLLDDRRGTAGMQRALGHLVGACRSEGRALPIMPVVMLGRGVVEAHLAAPLGRAPEPWRTHGHVWTVDLADLPRIGEDLDAYPALVQVGRSDGRAVLVDLAAAPGLIEIDGPDGDVGDLLTAIAGGLSRAPWSRGVRIRTLGARTVADRRVRPIERLSDVLTVGPVDVGGVRGRWGAPPRGSHEVVLLSRPVTEDEYRLVRQSCRARGAPTVIAPGRDRGVWQWRVRGGELTW